MDGTSTGTAGVSLLSGSGLLVESSITLYSGGRSWRFRLPSSSESENNILVVEYKLGAQWVQAAVYRVP
ncbi:FirrV-1-B13 precursor [Feldmannia irregularis virus a]|uniref:FirrV-1-B13 n=1 Tax=Feldmannia irregularis virus a TaxID=231992 RepID=Q6XM23_9PHYC|nr:FirrV-1-B13 precursor [Feldmannia irregularis virus a]AAR26888.1 FirrV-1-B13 precursor [Feldmannia irregularis virus a]